MQLRKWWVDGRQTCVWFQMKTAPWKSQTTVSCVTGSVAYWLHVTSFQAVSFSPLSQSHACRWEQVHCRLFHMPRPSNPQTNKPTRQAGRQPMHTVHSQSTGMYENTLIIHGWVKFKRFRALQARQEFTAWETTWSHCLVTRLAYETQSNILFIPLSVSDTKFQGSISVSIFNHKATPLKDKDGNICQQISWKHLNQH